MTLKTERASHDDKDLRVAIIAIAKAANTQINGHPIPRILSHPARAAIGNSLKFQPYHRDP
jgi:hypothetical protein